VCEPPAWGRKRHLQGTLSRAVASRKRPRAHDLECIGGRIGARAHGFHLRHERDCWRRLANSRADRFGEQCWHGLAIGWETIAGCGRGARDDDDMHEALEEKKYLREKRALEEEVKCQRPEVSQSHVSVELVPGPVRTTGFV
jgi:hypothetical protein